MKLIERKYLSSSSVLRTLDFAKIAQYFTLDVITAIAYGKAFGYLSKDADVHGYIETTEALVPVMNFVSVLPTLTRFVNLPWVRALARPSVRDKKGMGKLMAFVDELSPTMRRPFTYWF